MEYLSRVAKDFAKDGITARPFVLKGPPVEVILKYIRDNAIDLVIMSTNGSSGPAKLVIGSVTDHVLRQSSVPVMIVRPQECLVTT
jgi:nucleotide-binding universal stress UspA family protein